MAEVIHEHHTGSAETNSSSGLSFLMGIILLVVVLFLLFWYGLPLIRSASSGPNVQVPDKIDVNVNQPAAQ